MPLLVAMRRAKYLGWTLLPFVVMGDGCANKATPAQGAIALEAPTRVFQEHHQLTVEYLYESPAKDSLHLQVALKVVPGPWEGEVTGHLVLEGFKRVGGPETWTTKLPAKERVVQRFVLDREGEGVGSVAVDLESASGQPLAHGFWKFVFGEERIRPCRSNDLQCTGSGR